MIILVDTNVVLDVLMKREPYTEAAQHILTKCANREIVGYLAAHSIPNLFWNKAFWICLLSAVGMILLVYLTMTAAGQAMGAGGDVLRETGISGMAEQFAGGGLVTMFSAIFLCIWVISDYTHGAMKNVVGKGYSRVQVFLAKHLFGTLITTLMNLVIFLVILIIGLILIGTQHVGSLFFQNLFIYFGLQLLLASLSAVL